MRPTLVYSKLPRSPFGLRISGTNTYGTAFGSMQIVLHTRGRPQDIIPAVRTTVNDVDPNLPVSNVRTLDELVSASVATRRLTMLLLVIPRARSALSESEAAPPVRDSGAGARDRIGGAARI